MIPAVAWIDFINLYVIFTGNFYLNTPYFYGDLNWFIFVAVVIVVSVNSHCANLLIKTKRRIIDRVMENMVRVESRYHIPMESQRTFRKQLQKYLQITDLAEFAFGCLGRVNIEFSIFFTQFGVIIYQIISISKSLNKIITGCREVNTSDPKFNTTRCVDPDDVPDFDYKVYDCTADSQHLVMYMIIPFFIFCLMSMLRSPRQASVLSALSLVTLITSVIMITCNLILGDDTKFEVTVDYGFMLYATFSIPWIQLVTQIIPLEGSMVGTRRYFSKFLVVTTVISICGCMCFATVIYKHNFDVEKIICSISRMMRSVVLSVLGLIGVACLFPLLNFPLVDAFERRLLSAKICQENEETLSINQMPDMGSFMEVKLSPNKLMSLLRSGCDDVFRDPDLCSSFIITASWSRRYFLRFSLIATQIVFAMIMVFSETALMVMVSFCVFASRLVAFIFPCALHLNFSWNSLSLPIKLKDGLIIIASIGEIIWSLYRVFDYYNAQIFR